VHSWRGLCDTCVEQRNPAAGAHHDRPSGACVCPRPHRCVALPFYDSDLHSHTPECMCLCMSCRLAVFSRAINLCMYRMQPLQDRYVLRLWMWLIRSFLTAGELLLSGGRDATIRVWDLEVKCCRRTLPGHTADVLHLAALIPNLADAENEEASGSLASEEPPDQSMDLAAAPRRSLTDDHLPRVLSSCSADGTCRLWDVRTWTCVRIISPTSGDAPRQHAAFPLHCTARRAACSQYLCSATAALVPSLPCLLLWETGHTSS
jgi:hypothetical protein